MINSSQHTAFMVELFDEREILASPQAFQAFFGKPGSSDRTVFSESSKSVQIDIIRANGMRLAEMVNRGQSSKAKDSKNITDQKYTNVDRAFPLIEEEENINSDQLIQRMAGEEPFGSRSRIDRNRILARDLHMESVRKSVRTMEFLARESILTGTMPAILGTANTDLIYDFKRNPNQIFAAPVPWDNVAAKIMDDVDDGCALMEGNAFMSPNFLGIGDDAMAGFIKNTEVKETADNRRFELIEVSTNNPVPPEFSRLVAAGWIARGRLRTPKGRVLWIFNNNQLFTNSSNVIERYMPSDKAILLNTSARMDRYFGPADSLPLTPDEMAWQTSLFGFNMASAPIPVNVSKGGIVNPAMFHFDAYKSVDRKTETLRTQSAPIFATTQTDAIVTITDLTT